MDEKMEAINNFIDAEVKLYDLLADEFINTLDPDSKTNRNREILERCDQNLNMRKALVASITALNRYLESLA